MIVTVKPLPRQSHSNFGYDGCLLSFYRQHSLIKYMNLRISVVCVMEDMNAGSGPCYILSAVNTLFCSYSLLKELRLAKPAAMQESRHWMLARLVTPPIGKYGKLCVMPENRPKALPTELLRSTEISSEVTYVAKVCLACLLNVVCFWWADVHSRLNRFCPLNQPNPRLDFPYLTFWK